MPKAVTPNLETLSVSQLMKLQSEIPTLIKRKSDERQEAFKQKLARMAQDEGFDLYKLFGGALASAQAEIKTPAPAKAKTNGVAIKYRDPANPSNTWTGRGREPRWLSALTKSGHKRDEYRV